MSPVELLEQLFSSVLVVDHQGEVVESFGRPLGIQNVFDSPLLNPAEELIRTALGGFGFERILNGAEDQFRLRGAATKEGVILCIDFPLRSVIQIGHPSATSPEAHFLAQNLRQGMWQLNSEGVIEKANAWMASWLGLELKDLVGRSASEFIVVRQQISDSAAACEFISSDSITKQAVVNWSDLSDPCGCVCGSLQVISDVSLDPTDKAKQAKDAKALSRLARLDGLTGLGNRLALQESLAKIQAAKVEFGIIVANVDQFGAISSADGPLGDRALKEVARRLRKCVRREDVAVRVGRDVFAILIANAGASTLEEVAFRVESTVQFLMPAGSHRHVEIRMSIGAAHSTDGVRDVYRAADNAMLRRRKSRQSRRDAEDHLY